MQENSGKADKKSVFQNILLGDLSCVTEKKE